MSCLQYYGLVGQGRGKEIVYFKKSTFLNKEKNRGKESAEQGFELEVGDFGRRGADGANGASARGRPQ